MILLQAQQTSSKGRMYWQAVELYLLQVILLHVVIQVMMHENEMD